MEIRDSVVIVTGASSGLGEALARLFAAQGAKVALVARSAAPLARLAASLPGALAAPTDLRDAAAIGRMVTQVQEHYGRIDLLINNAGQGMAGPLEHVDLAQYRQLMDLNLYAPLLTMQAVIPIMRAQGGGLILNISSGTTQIALHIPGLGAYSSTKYALNAISLTAQAELAADNIRVGTIYPGMMSTAFGAHMLGAAPAWLGGGPGGAVSLPAGAPLPVPPAAVAATILDAVRDEPAAAPPAWQPETPA